MATVVNDIFEGLRPITHKGIVQYNEDNGYITYAQIFVDEDGNDFYWTAEYAPSLEDDTLEIVEEHCEYLDAALFELYYDTVRYAPTDL